MMADLENPARKVRLLPLRRHELPSEPAVPLALPPERDTFVVPGERMGRDELRAMARPVVLPPLHASEVPDTAVRAIRALPDSHLDDPEWGTAKRAPEILMGRVRLLRPWDE